MPSLTSRNPVSYTRDAFAWFDVRSYGAKCDATALGVGTDDTAAIQAAITAAQAVNGTVYIPGRCKITSTLTVTESVTIRGPGAASDSLGTVSSGGFIDSLIGAIGYIPAGQIIKTFTGFDAITVTGTGSVNTSVHIHDLGIGATTAGKYHTAGAGVRLTDTVGAILERVTIFNQFDGVKVDGDGWMTRIRDCEIALVRNCGVKRVGGTNYHAFHMSGCQITNAGVYVAFTAEGDGTTLWGQGAGVYLEQCVPVISGCDVIGFQKGFYVGTQAQYGFFTNCYGDTCTLPWQFTGTHCIGHTVTSCEAYVHVSGTVAVDIAGASDLSWIGGNVFASSSAISGFQIDSSAKSVHVSDVRFHFAGYTSPLGAFGSTGGTPALFGKTFVLLSGAHDFQITNNRAVRGSGEIYLNGSHTYGYIYGNTGTSTTGSTAGTGNSMTNGPY